MTEPVVLPITISGNALRKELILSASKTNQQAIWLGGEENAGTPLLPDEKITLKTNQAITVLGETGDWLYVAELVSVPPVSRPTEDTP